MCSMALPWDALITIVLYLVGVPLLLGQTASASVRHVLLNEIGDRMKLVIALSTAVATALLFGVCLFCVGGIVSLGVLLVLTMIAVFFSVLGLMIVHLRSLVFFIKHLAVKAFQSGRNEEFERYVEYISLLGRESNTAEARSATIRTLGEVIKSCTALQSSEGTLLYDGTTLEKAIWGMKNVLLKPSSKPSLMAFSTFIREARDVLDVYDQLPFEVKRKKDSAELAYALSEVGCEVMKLYPYSKECDRAPGLLGEHSWLGKWATHSLVNILKEAVVQHHSMAIMSALTGIRQVLVEQSTNGEEIFYDYIGAIAFAHLHCSIPGKRFAEQLWQEFCEANEQELNSACRMYVEKAYNHHAQSGRFALADAIHHTSIAPSSPLPQSLAPSIP